MSEPFGNYLKLTVDGTSRGPSVRCRMTGFPAGIPVSSEQLTAFLGRRAPGRSPLTTARREPDIPLILSGISGGITDGSPIEIEIRNTDAAQNDTEDRARFPRPGHADLAAVLKYGRQVDLRGGGRFSGRMTAPLCAAGGICLQYLQTRGIRVYARLCSVGPIEDTAIDSLLPDYAALEEAAGRDIHVVSADTAERIRALIDKVRENKDSVGGTVECFVTGLPAGLGEHMFRSVEAALCDAVMAIPGVRGIEFGDGFASSARLGSQNNDGYQTDGTRILFASNRSGGILGGMTTSAPVRFRCAFKPTPSIGLPQKTVDLDTMTDADITTGGRNDPCIALRAVPVVEAAAALAFTDLLLSDISAENELGSCRRGIDLADAGLSTAFDARMRAVSRIAAVKQQEHGPVYVPAREQEVVRNALGRVSPQFCEETEELYRTVLRLSRNYQKNSRPKPMDGLKDKQIVLLGNPVEHSASPELHRHIGDYAYRLRRTGREELAAVFADRSADGWNVTVPFKKDVIPCLDRLSADAEAIGAVNTVVREPDGTLTGYNTDVIGFADSLDRLCLPEDTRHAVILGNGGAAAAVRYVLRNRGFSVDTVTRKDPGTLHFGDLPAGLFRGCLLVQATPAEMYPGEAVLPLKEEEIASCAGVIDLVYRPLRTPLLQTAQKHGIPSLGGLCMLVSQGVRSAELFFGKKAGTDACPKILAELTRELSDIVLVGMPGSGKSAAGQLLSELTGRRLFDTDRDIEERTGFSPADYLRRFGEEAFREEETVSVRTASHLRGAVIATGGGAILREQNRRLLRGCGRVFLLDRPLSDLPADNRPLTEKHGAACLYRERLPLYLDAADETVPVLDLARTAQDILNRFEEHPI